MMNSFSDLDISDELNRVSLDTDNVNVNEISNISDSNIEKSFSSMST